MPTDAELLAAALNPYQQQADPALVAALANPAAPDVPVQSSYLAELGTAPTVQSTGGPVRAVTPAGQALAAGVADTLMAPGRAFTGEMQVRDPETGHMTDGATDWGAGTALGMLGGSSVPRVAVGAGETALGSGPIRAYHGSPHDFDAFDLSKIGTGEGAQAYGHGMYYAGNEAVAQGYRDALARETYLTPSGSLWTPDSLQHMNVRVAARRNGPDLDATIARAQDLLGSSPPEAAAGMLQSDIGALQTLKDQGGVTPNPGRMYEVGIHADPSHLIDYDAPLSAQQPVVRQMLGSGLPDPRTVMPDPALRSIIDKAARQASHPDEIPMVIDNDQSLYKSAMNLARQRSTPEQYQMAMDLEQSPGDYVGAAAAPYLKALAGHAATGDDLLKLYRGREGELAQAGVPGVKYFDAGSRSASDGSSNYVVFNPQIVEIMRKYGVSSLAALPPGVLATMGLGSDGQPDTRPQT